ncbi:MAG: hypothetical protein KDI82_06585 [Gammaproteobacteria bacterium]|nr:hypothetical protein [Gammaproteobacteria bacterium]
MSRESLNAAMAQLGERLASTLRLAQVRGLYLPAPVADETGRDAFGFVLLDDGSVGPFYVSLGELLRTLWRRYPEPRAARVDIGEMLEGFASDDVARRALAVGCYNALSAALMRRAGFRPDGQRDERQDADPHGTEKGGTVGMVGYFEPLIGRLLASGIRVRVLELAPQRVVAQAGVRCVHDAAELHNCSQVLCSASTLVNDSLPELLTALQGRVPVELVGPSCSGLPDPLFELGVAAIGGTAFAHAGDLFARLDRGDSWREAGRKYRLHAGNYPGLETLLRRLAERDPHADQA